MFTVKNIVFYTGILLKFLHATFASKQNTNLEFNFPQKKHFSPLSALNTVSRRKQIYVALANVKSTEFFCLGVLTFVLSHSHTI